MKEKLEKQLKKQIQAYESRKKIGINSEENLQSLFLELEHIFNPVKSEGKKDD
tara:strand:+ start:194 stop:352 length:159 start_codon:yes stop_codon:yes gene_type:complete